MAVKQNNAENSNHVSSAKKQKNSKQNQNSKQTTKNEAPQFVENNQQYNNTNIGANKENSSGNVNNRLSIEKVLMYFEMLHKKQDELTFNETLKYCSDCIKNMSELPEPHAAPEIKQFKENILRIGHLLKEIAANDRHTFYLRYLKVVCDLIATEGLEPCYAIAIIFQLFPEDYILKAVILPLNAYRNDDKIIKKSVRILCDWLRKCTFCSNLNLWILAILSELKKDAEKYDLFTETALIVIEPLTIALIIPILRPKVYPIVLDILMSFKDSPIVFHKILSRIPLVLKQLKRECETATEHQEETKKIFHELVDLMSALVENFPNHQELYGPLTEIISQCQKSQEYRSALIGGNASYISDSQMDYNNVLISNNPKVGLVNLGNTCYMNSVLQALLMTKDFCRDILLFKARSPVLFKIQQFFALLLHSSRPELTPSVILQVARPPGFAPGFQQDSSEFLGYFLETLHEHELKSIKATEQSAEKQKQKTDTERISSKESDAEMSDSKENDVVDGVLISKNIDSEIEDCAAVAMEIDETPDSSIKELKKSETKNTIHTTIDKNFTGKIATTYKCLECAFQSKNIDSFRELQLSFPDQKQSGDGIGFPSNSSGNTNSYSVQDLLDFYCSTEKLNEDNQYFCEKCKKLCDGERSQNCVIPPKNLILTLKQFKYDQKYNMRAKLMHRIYHNENLSLNIYSPNDNVKLETINYCMYAAVVHTGFNMDSGHYYTYAKDMMKNLSRTSTRQSNVNENNDESNHFWYKFNDNYVTECSEIELQNMNPPNTPYILFYRMKSRNRLDGCKTEIKPTIGPYLEELPSCLRNYIDTDNDEYKAEKERYAQPNKIRLILRSNNNNNSNNSRKDDDENGSGGGGATGGNNSGDPPPPNCGDNVLGNNFNNFIY